MLKDPHRRSLPESLRSRLQAIPRQVVVCRDRERLYAAARAAAHGQEPEPLAAEHLESCGRCRTLYGALKVAFAEVPPAPTPTLFDRLKGVARGLEPLPAWIADGRWATAACLLLSVVLTAVAGDSAAMFRDASSNLETRAAVWAESGESRGRQMWAGLSAGLSNGLAATYETGRQTLDDLGESCQTLYHRAAESLGSLVNSYRPSPTEQPSDPEGDSDEESAPESP